MVLNLSPSQLLNFGESPLTRRDLAFVQTFALIFVSDSHITVTLFGNENPCLHLSLVLHRAKQAANVILVRISDAVTFSSWTCTS